MAEMTEISCSTLLPPNMTASFIFIGIPPLIIVGKVVFEQDDLLLIRSYRADLCERIAERGRHKYVRLVKACLDKTFVYALRLPFADEGNIVADCGGVSAEFAVVLLLLVAKLDHAGRDENLLALEEAQSLKRRFRAARV